jgi:hypothetical protein
MIYLLLIPVVLSVLVAALQPKYRWVDDDDVRWLVWHTVRLPSPALRHLKWQAQYYLMHDMQGTRPERNRFVLPVSRILNEEISPC